MSDKVPYVKVSAGFYLKDAPEGYLGLKGENWTFGNEPISLGSLVGGLVSRLLQFYITVMPILPDDLNTQIKEVGAAILALEVEEG